MQYPTVHVKDDLFAPKGVDINVVVKDEPMTLNFRKHGHGAYVIVDIHWLHSVKSIGLYNDVPIVKQGKKQHAHGASWKEIVDALVVTLNQVKH